MNFIRELYENNKKQFHIGILLLILIILLIVIHTMTKKDNPEKENNTTQTETTADSSGTEVESETAPVLTWTPDSGDSELTSLISAFYNAYVISGDINQVSPYIDSTTGINENRLAINKKYIERVSDFVCYQTDLDIIDENYLVMVVTYKVKLYNYEELLPSIDILFLVNGEMGYRIHNLTVDDQFDKQKITNDTNFQILSAQVSDELNTLLSANPDLNQVYNLYLNPDSSAQQ